MIFFLFALIFQAQMSSRDKEIAYNLPTTSSLSSLFCKQQIAYFITISPAITKIDFITVKHRVLPVYKE